MALPAHELGFGDQAHMTRALRSTVGIPPGQLRALLTPPADTASYPSVARGFTADGVRGPGTVTGPAPVDQMPFARAPPPW
ncbi:hypothetical protein [Streptomyces sp. NPDC002540]